MVFKLLMILFIVWFWLVSVVVSEVVWLRMLLMVVFCFWNMVMIEEVMLLILFGFNVWKSG